LATTRSTWQLPAALGNYPLRFATLPACRLDVIAIDVIAIDDETIQGPPVAFNAGQECVTGCSPLTQV